MCCLFCTSSWGLSCLEPSHVVLDKTVACTEHTPIILNCMWTPECITKHRHAHVAQLNPAKRIVALPTTILHALPDAKRSSWSITVTHDTEVNVTCLTSLPSQYCMYASAVAYKALTWCACHVSLLLPWSILFIGGNSHKSFLLDVFSFSSDLMGLSGMPKFTSSHSADGRFCHSRAGHIKRHCPVLELTAAIACRWEGTDRKRSRAADGVMARWQVSMSS